MVYYPTAMDTPSRDFRLAPLLTSLLLVLVSGCQPTPSAVAIWGGFDYSWERLSHRVSFFESGLGEPSPDGSFAVDLGMIGGPFSLSTALPEVVNYRAPWWWVRSNALAAHYAEVPLSIGPSGIAREDVSVDMDSIGLASEGVVTVALTGLRWDMDTPQSDEFPDDYDPAEGWTPQVLGAGVEGVTVSDGQLSFSLWLEFRAGSLDREDMNDAIEFLTIDGSLGYVVLAADGAHSVGQLQAAAWYPIDPPNSDIPVIDAAQRTVSIDGEDGLPLAVPLVHSWRFVLNRELDEEGRYLRALSAALEQFEYSAEDGRATLVMDAYCSHSSVIEEGELQVEFSAELGLLQISDADASVLSGEIADSVGVGPFQELVVP